MKYLAAGLFLCLLCIPGHLVASSILTTKHNLALSGPGPIKSEVDEICIFCHTPHHAQGKIPYLWNRAETTATYVPYQSSTLYAAVGQPTGASKLCLSCHDGTIALGAILSRPDEVPFAGGLRFLPTESRTRLDTDLSDDHPVSFVYDAALALANPQLINPNLLPAEIRLDNGNQLQCTACHDPHDDRFGKFLVMTDEFSALCTSCHDMAGWSTSAHALAEVGWSGDGTDPWAHAAYDSVARNGCRNCHVSHGAGRHEQLLNYLAEEDNCLVCHSGQVASKDIEVELLKTYGHKVQNYFNIHEPTEDFTSGTMAKHVECSDCHNPHRANAESAAAGPGPQRVSGANAGVTGADISGQALGAAEFEFEICFKCHGDTSFVGVVPVFRQIDQKNTRLEFDPANPSYHPLVEKGANSLVPSLTPPLDELSLIGCGDCHGNSNPGGVQGPHGSDYPYLLRANYETVDLTTETPTAYALCYQCHSRDNLLGNHSFPQHFRHIVQEQTPCSACHDPHGISFADGDATNHSHLINFDLDIVSADPLGRLTFEKLGTLSGQCFLSCHGVPHDQTKSY